MDISQASGPGFLWPGLRRRGGLPANWEDFGAMGSCGSYAHTVGEGTHEEGAPKDLGDSSLLLNGAVRTGMLLTDKKGLTAMDELYETFVSEPYPARKTVYVRLSEGLTNLATKCGFCRVLVTAGEFSGVVAYWPERPESSPRRLTPCACILAP